MGTKRYTGWGAGRLFGPFFLAAVIITCFFTQVWAEEVLFVGPGGYETIQQAIDDANPGDTILVGPGTYSETVTIDKKINLVAESIHDAILLGSFIIKADDVSIDGFYVDGASDWGWTAIDIDAAGVSVTNTIINTAGNESVLGLEIDSEGGGVWEFQGSIDLHSTDGYADGVDVQVGDDAKIVIDGAMTVTAENSSASGIWVQAGDNLEISLKDVAVTSDSVADGIYITGPRFSWFRGDNTTLHVDGDVTVTSDWWAYGVSIIRDNNITATVTGNITVSGWEDVWGARINGYSDVSFSSGDVTVTGEKDAHGIEFGDEFYGGGLGNDASLNVGNVTVTANANDSEANGLLIAQDDYNGNGLTVTTKNVVVSGGSRAQGIYLLGGGDVDLFVDGLLQVSANSNAYGMDVTSGNDLSLTVSEFTKVTAGQQASAIKVNTRDGANITLGDVTVQGGTSAVGADLSVRDNSVVNIGGSFNVSATGNNANATALKLSADNNAYVGVAGDVVVSTRRNATGISADLWDNGTVIVEGLVSVESATGKAEGVSVQGRSNLSVSTAGVEVEGVNAQGVLVNAGNYSGATLTVDGDVKVTGASGSNRWAEGVALIGRNDLSATITGDVDVTGGGDVVGVRIQGNENVNTTLTIDGDIKATVGDGGFSAVGIDLTSGNNLSVSVVGDIEASGGEFAYGARLTTLSGTEISLGDVTAKDGLTVYGVSLTASDGASLNVGKVTATTEKNDGTAVGLELWVGDESTIEVDSIDVEAHGDAEGMKLRSGGSEMSVDVAGGFDVRSHGPDGTAVGLSLDDVDSSELTLGGTSSVQAIGSAMGIDIGADAPAREITLRNLGELQVSGSDATGIRLSVGERAIVENKGVIAVDSPAGGGIAVDARASTGVTELINDGVIQGDVLLGTGDDLLVIGSTGQIDGDVDLGSGDDTAILYDGATLGILDGGDGNNVLRLLDAVQSETPLALGMHPLSTGVASKVTARNFDTVEIEGGRWEFGEGSDVGMLEMTGGTVGGNSTFSGSFHNVSGTLAPGNSFGIVTVAGDYIQGEDALLSIEVRPSSDPKPGIDHDQLVVGGTARFEAGTTIQVLPLPGAYAKMTRYVIVDGELEDFDPSALNLDFPELLLLKGSLAEGSLVLLVESLPLESIAQSALQKAVAAVLDKVTEDSGTDLNGLYEWLSQLSADQQSEALQALDSISGEVYGYVPAMAVRSADRIGEAVVRGISDPAANKKHLWAAAYSDTGKLSRESDALGAFFDTRGFVTGADLVSGPRLRIGLAAGGGTETLSFSGLKSEVRGDSRRLGAYGHFGLGEARLTLFAGYGIASYVSDRAAVYGTVAYPAKAHFDLGSALLWAEAGYEPVQLGGLTIKPVASMGWLSVSQTQIKEDGADDLSLTVEPFSTQRLVGRIGVELETRPIWAGSVPVTPRAKFAWINDYAAKSLDQTARFAGAEDSPYAIPVGGLPTSGFEASLGVGGTIGQNVTWSLDYTGEFHDDGRRDRVQGQVQFAF